MSMWLDRFNLFGPIFTKELRTTSRRRRYYVLRGVYIALLLLCLSMMWYETMRWTPSALDIMARMAEVAKEITALVIWFVFIVCQMVAIVGLSTSISDEISHQTLGVLMTTPITSLQIVMGKLLSRLLQLCLLIGITLPILATIRVFGGVPWPFVWSCLIVILCNSLCVGSLSLFFSIYANRAYAAIIATVLTLATLNGIVPGLIGVYFERHIPTAVFNTALAWTNSYVLLGMLTDAMMSPRSWLTAHPTLWWKHCLVLLGVSGLLIVWAALRVRVIGLRLIAGDMDSRARRRSASRDGAAKLRRVSDRPILWKELRQPLWGRHKKRKLFLLGLILLIMVLFYAGLARQDALQDKDTHIGFGIMLMAVGFLYSTVIPATGIATEKETRAWPILLGTALTPGDILMGKWWGSLRTSMPAWILLFGHVAIFTSVQVIHPLSLPLLALALAGPIAFLLGSGLFFSNRCRRTTTAVIANLVLAGGLWILLPMFAGMLAGFTRVGRHITDFLELLIRLHPLTQVIVILQATADSGSSIGRFEWPGQRMGLTGTLVLLSFSTLIYTALGGLFMLITRRQLRKRIF